MGSTCGHCNNRGPNTVSYIREIVYFSISGEGTFENSDCKPVEETPETQECKYKEEGAILHVCLDKEPETPFFTKKFAGKLFLFFTQFCDSGWSSTQSLKTDF